MRHGPTVPADPFDQDPTTTRRKTSVTVSHEDLQWVDDVQSPLHSEVFTHPRTVTNVPAEYT